VLKSTALTASARFDGSLIAAGDRLMICKKALSTGLRNLGRSLIVKRRAVMQRCPELLSYVAICCSVLPGRKQKA